jgi:hypothetical protein
MEAEPPKVEPPKRKCRWFQFSLRTLLIVVTLAAVACWVVADRQRLIRERDDALRAQATVDAWSAANAARAEAEQLAQQSAMESAKHREQIEVLKAALREKNSITTRLFGIGSP